MVPRSEDQTSAAQTLKCQAGMEDAFEMGSTRFKDNGLRMMLKCGERNLTHRFRSQMLSIRNMTALERCTDWIG